MIIRYEHHGRHVAVDDKLKGTHRDHCLCFQCQLFIPERPSLNCPMANLLFAVDCAFNLVTPVYECPKFMEPMA